MEQRRAAFLAASLLMSLACGDAGGPDLHGPAFFRATVDGATWTTTGPYAFCGDYALIISGQVANVIPNTEVLEIRVADLASTGTFVLGDSSTGRYAHTLNLQTIGPRYRTRTLQPGRFAISAVDFADSLIAGTFSFRLISATDSTDTHQVVGSFRLPLSAIYTAAHPEGTPCHAAT